MARVLRVHAVGVANVAPANQFVREKCGVADYRDVIFEGNRSVLFCEAAVFVREKKSKHGGLTI